MLVSRKVDKSITRFRGLTVMTADSDSASEGSTPSETCFLTFVKLYNCASRLLNFPIQYLFLLFTFMFLVFKL
ncbi:NAD-dependent protein deacetylase hst2-1 [Fusarium oxysporum f. sp. albedinis]|nr:NAD-dependent protein deacetylase hst2-1 [Fusarium oxysporum f. sp. albedinis]